MRDYQMFKAECVIVGVMLLLAAFLFVGCGEMRAPTAPSSDYPPATQDVMVDALPTPMVDVPEPSPVPVPPMPTEPTVRLDKVAPGCNPIQPLHRMDPLDELELRARRLESNGQLYLIYYSPTPQWFVDVYLNLVGNEYQVCFWDTRG